MRSKRGKKLAAWLLTGTMLFSGLPFSSTASGKEVVEDNIAMEASASASSYLDNDADTYAAANAIDGDLGTSWVCFCKQGVSWDSSRILTLSWDSLVSMKDITLWPTDKLHNENLYVSYILKGIRGDTLASGQMEEIYGTGEPVEISLDKTVSGVKTAEFSIGLKVEAGSQNDSFGFKEISINGSYDAKTPIASYQEISVATTVGEAPVLPETVTALHEDGTESQVDVIWEEIDAEKYAQPGSFTVTGTVADDVEVNPGVVPTATVFVNAKETFGFQAGDLLVELNGAGVITGLINQKDSVNYAVGEDVPQNPLIKLVIAPSEAEGGERSGKDGTESRPISMTTNENVMTFRFDNGVEVDVTIEEKDSYTTLTVTRLEKNGVDVEMLVWGPISTNIEENFGETVGAVYNDSFAIGYRGVNDKTQMAVPYEYSGITVDGQERLNVCYPIDKSKMKGRQHDLAMCAASPTTWGSTLQAYTYDATVERVRRPWLASINGPGIDLRVPAQEGDLAVIEGSEIALYGKDFAGATAKDAVLETVEKIELGEGLPHPMIDGEWQKTSEKASRPYFIADVNAGSVEKLSQYANQANIDYIYQNTLYNSSGAGASYEFPNGDQAMKEDVVDKAAKYGVRVGTHTLSGFIDTNDKYITEKVNKGNFGGQLLARLTRDAKAGDTEVFVTDDWIDYGDTKQLGDDLFFSAVTAEKDVDGYKITLPTALKNDHAAGEEMIGLYRNGYGGYVAGLEQIDGIAKRLAESFNNTGISQISFDGVEVGMGIGMGMYGVNHLMNEFYRNLDPEIQANIVNDSSGGYAGSWDFQTRGNWGEPWGAPMRGGMIDYRYDNQVYFERNFMPKMLGWFMYNTGEPTIDIEWMLSKSAGFDAGYALVTSTGTLDANGNTPEVLEAVKQWQLAREADAFTEDQKARMLDTSSDWHLETVGENRWNLYRINYPIDPVTAGYSEDGTSFDYTSPFHHQDLHLELRAENGNIQNPVVTVGNKTVSFTTVIPQNGYLVYDNGEAAVYDGNWNKLDTAVTVDDAGVLVMKGKNKVKVAFEADNNSINAKVRILTESDPEPVFPGNTAEGPVEEPAENPNPENLAFQKPVTAGNMENGTLQNNLEKIVDGITASEDANNVEFTPANGAQEEKAYVTVDLEQSYDLSEVKFYSFTTHDYPGYYRINHNTVVMVSNDPNFQDESTKIIYNNDSDNSMGFGVGTDAEEQNTPSGKSIVFDKPVNARYIRYYQDGAGQWPTPGEKPGILSLVELEAYEYKEEDSTIYVPDCKTYVGIEPTLPSMVETEENGETVYLPVEWNEIPEGSCDKVCRFTVEGVVAGTDRKAAIDVVVTDQPIISLNGDDVQQKDVSVAGGVYGVEKGTELKFSFYYDKTLLFFPQDGSGVKALQEGVSISDFTLNNESAVFSFTVTVDGENVDYSRLFTLDFTVREDVKIGSGKMASVEGRSAEVTAGGETISVQPSEFKVFLTEEETPEEPANKTLLQKTYDYALTLSTEGVTDSAKAYFEKVVAEAKAVLDDPKATQEEVNAAWDELLEGIWGLGLTQGNKTMLEQLIAKAEAMIPNQDRYVQDHWQQLVDALEAAKKVMADGDAMEEDVQPAAEALLNAILAQRFKADKSILEDLINKANSLDLSGYTAESVAVFKAALAEANQVLADESLSEDDQGIVDAAVQKLDTAIENLSTNDDGETTKPDDGSSSDNSDKGDNSSSADKTPATGDYTVIWIWMVIAAASLTLATLVIKLRKRENF